MFTSSVPGYRFSLALFTDLYQLTMLAALIRAGVHKRRAAFDIFFRRNPFGGGYAVAAGLAYVLDHIQHARFEREDIEFLARQRGNDDNPLFPDVCLRYLEEMKWELDIDAVHEGQFVFAHEPLLRALGPIGQCLLLESIMLGYYNPSTMIATRAARIVHAAKGDPVTDGGMRRAPGLMGGLDVARNSFLAGFAGTSNVAAARLFDIPVFGTMSHALVQFFGDELEAFQRYAEALPNNVVFLVDTYEIRQGLRNAIAIAKDLERIGHRAKGVRIDSGDLAKWSIEARHMLDAAGLSYMKVLASNDLEEESITSLKQQGAPISLWLVGTKVAAPGALGGVFKLTSVEGDEGWSHRIKVSAEPAKTSIPGIRQVRRYYDRDGMFLADVIHDREHAPRPGDVVRHLRTNVRIRVPEREGQDLLFPVVRSGEVVYNSPTLREMRVFCQQQLAQLPEGMKRLQNPDEAFVGLEPHLYALRERLIDEAWVA